MRGRNDAKDYRLRAQHCLDIANDMDSGARKLALLEMAQAWIRLALQAERNEKNDVVYVAPARRLMAQPQPDPQASAKPPSASGSPLRARRPGPRHRPTP